MSFQQRIAQIVNQFRASYGVRTPNTEHLDRCFDPSQEYSTVATLGEAGLEWLGDELLRAARRKAHFVAISPYELENQNRYRHAAKKGFLIVETLPGKVIVVSPSYEMALRMYGHDKLGNTPAIEALSEEEIRTTPLIGDLVDRLYTP